MFIALLALFQSIALSIILILLPLFTLGRDRAGRTTTFILFGSLGIGYFLVEIVFIQRFTLFLGHSVYAAAAVLTSMLIGSGLGALRSSRLGAGSKSVGKAAAIVALVTLLYIPLLEIVFRNAISLPLGWRAVISLVTILPPAFAMGFPFPLGLRFVAQRWEAHVPWAWGVNGCLSVVGAAGAGLLALEFGFTAVIAVAAVMYGLAAVPMLVRTDR